MSANITIDVEHEPTIREWVTSGRGITVWTNLEIGGSAAHEVFTPGDVGAPNWRYGRPEQVDVATLQINEPVTIAQFRGRFKARYWGPDVADATRAKADKLAARHNGASWDWVYDIDCPGCVQVRIVRAHLRPFVA